MLKEAQCTVIVVTHRAGLLGVVHHILMLVDGAKENALLAAALRRTLRLADYGLTLAWRETPAARSFTPALHSRLGP